MQYTDDLKAILLKIGNVRVIRHDAMNLAVERYEVVIGRDGESRKEWKFKGYTRTKRTALQFIIRNDLLVKEEATQKVSEYLDEIEELFDKMDAKLSGKKKVKK